MFHDSRYRRVYPPFTVPIASLICLLAASAGAATITVTSAADSGDGTLRKAVADAANLDTIVFDPSLDGTPIVLSTEILTDKRISIIGNGPSRTILDGNEVTRVLKFTNETGTAVLDSVSVVNGYVGDGYGAGIQKWGNGALLILRCNIASNSALEAGAIDIEGSSNVNARQTLFQFNKALSGNGGAIQLYSPGGSPRLTCSECTFSGNSANNQGGAIDNSSSGGDVILTSCTVFGNLANDGGGLRNASAGGMDLRNTIVAGNVSSSDAAKDDYTGLAVSGLSGNNLLGKVGDSGLSNGINGDIVGTAGSPVNPGLNALADNGGFTKTHSLAAVSPARNAGSNARLIELHYTTGGPADQRGFHRVMGSQVDIGAYEEGVYPNSFGVIIINNTGDSLGDPLNGSINLRAALEHTEPGKGVAILNGTYTLNAPSVRMRWGITVGGLDPATTVPVSVAASPEVIIDRYASGTVYLGNLAFASTPPANNFFGGHLLNESPQVLYLRDCLIQNGRANFGGGLALLEGARATISRCLFTDNVTDFYGMLNASGGAIYMSPGSFLLMENTTLDGNGDSNTTSGGALYVSTGAVATISSCTISANAASFNGGGISAYSGGTVHISNSILATNTATTLPEERNLSGTLQTEGYNHFGGLPSGSGVTAGVNGDVVDGANPPNLNPLADNGGPTMTRSLDPVSPAVNSGSNLLASVALLDPRYDQRSVGFDRIKGYIIDKGAFESDVVPPTSPTPSPSFTPTVSATPTVSVTPTASPTPSPSPSPTFFACGETRSGVFDSNSPMFRRPEIENDGAFSPSCIVPVVGLHTAPGAAYAALPVYSTASSSEPFLAQMVESGTTLSDPSLLVYCDPFDPAAPEIGISAYAEDSGYGPNGFYPAFVPFDEINLAPLTQYWLVVTTYAFGQYGAWEVCLGGSWKFGFIPPTITQHPQSQSANVGQRVAFHAEAAGEPTLIYSWEKVGTGSISGAVTNDLEVGPLTLGDAGPYRMVVERAGEMAQVRSNTAQLTVFDPPAPNAAAYLANSIPPTMYEGQELYVAFDWQNTSSLTWSAAQGYSLGVQEDAAGLFGGTSRMFILDPNLKVHAEGGIHAFVGRITAPATSGTRTIKLRMVEEGVEFFGPVATITVNVVPRPNTVAEWSSYE